ncbi:ricin-type beta-trefoil lectin domain protein [Streptomyces sp. NPDC002990]
MAAIAGSLQLSASAFGTETAEPEAVTSAPAPAPAAVEAHDAHVEDFGASANDNTSFKNGVMSLGPRPAPMAAARAAAAAPPQGEGWKLSVSGAVKWLSAGYTVKFYDQKSADWLAPYVKASAADIQRNTNVRVSVDTKPVGWDYARPKGEVIMGVLHRPCLPPAAGSTETGWQVVRDGSGSPNLSCGFHSASEPATVTSGHAYIDSEFFTADGKPSASMGETYMRNHISHELGHSLGIAHANRSETRGDCAKGTDSGQVPVMCTPAYAYQDKRAGAFVQQFDVQGLRYLAAGAGAALPPQGKVSGLAGKCMDVKGGKAANGTPIQLYTCNGSWAQSWILAKDGTFRALGKCLDNAGNGTANGNKIRLYDCNGTPAQRWSANAKGQIVHTASGKVLDVTGGNTANGTAIQLYTSNSTKAQIWATPKS